MKRQFFGLVLLALWVTQTSVQTGAQTSFPMLGATYPVGVRRGTTSVVTLRAVGNGGANLYKTYKALFAAQGIVAEVLPPEKPVTPDPKKPNEIPVVLDLRLKVTVPADAEIGLHEYRIVTANGGASTCAQLMVSDETEVTETDEHNKSGKPQILSVPCAVSGKLEKNGEEDIYGFHAEAGQEIVFTVLCARLQDKIHELQEHCDPLMVLRDKNGVELARNDDFYHADPALTYKFAQTGDYTLQLRDVNYKGEQNWVYRLSLWTRPWLLSANPCAVKPGQTLDLAVSGWNLGGAKTAKVMIPANTSPGIHVFTPSVNGVSVNPISLLVETDSAGVRVAQFTDADSIHRLAPINTDYNAEKRLIVNAQRPTPNATPNAAPNAFPYHMKKGETLQFEMIAQRLGATVDGELRLRNAKGDIVASADDTFGKDPAFTYTANEEGDFTLETRDISGVTGDRRFYVLKAEAPKPDFTVRCDPNRAMIAPGNQTCLFVQIERKNGFNGEVVAKIEGLPAGVTATTATIAPNMTTGTVFLTAENGAKVDATLARIIASATVNGTDSKPVSLAHNATPIAEIYMPGGGRGRWEAETLAVAVTEPNDLTLSVDKPVISLKPGGEIKLEVTIKRRDDFKKAVPLDSRLQHFEVFCNPLPPGVTIAETTIPEGQNKGTITLKVDQNAPPVKDLQIPVMGFVSINFVMKTWFVAPVTLTIEKNTEKK